VPAGNTPARGRSALGSVGEEAARLVYCRRGFRVVGRNWRCPAGELDLILARGPLLVFCEVKTRTGIALGGAFEAVTPRKQRKLRQLAEIFLAQQGLRPPAVRFDVASVRGSNGDRPPEVEIFEDAF
jgi:putative endonuclease